jgi:hypothetical protein
MNEHSEVNWKQVALVFALVGGVAAASRFMEFAPNFAAVGAAALFAGYVLRRPMLAMALPMAAMLVSDAAIGFYDVPMMVVVYASLALPALWSARWGRLNGWGGSMKVMGAAAGAGLGFFVTTNFAWWVFWSSSHTMAGLVAAYIDALPFLKYTLAGNLCFAAVFFGAHALVVSAARDRRVAAAIA